MNEPSHLRAGMRLLLRGVRERAPRAAVGAEPRRRAALERRGITADERRVRRFLRVTGGEPAEWEGRLVLPPGYSALWETALALELLAEPGAPLPDRGVIHLESELMSVRPLPAGEPIRCRMEMDRVEPGPKGARVWMQSRSWNAAGQLCQDNRLALLVRTTRPVARWGMAPAEEHEHHAVPADEWAEVRRWELGGGAGRRYARVSGDYNPIHLWPWSARLLGFDRPILHGFCLEAMVANALVARFMGGDPTALRRLRIAFRSPLRLPASVRLLAGSTGSGGDFRVVNGRDPAARPFAEGEWVGAAD